MPKPPPKKKPANKRPAPLTVSLSLDVRDDALPITDWLEAQLRRAAAFAGIGGEVGILVVGDRRMAQLHLDYKQVAGTTDCLTFDLSGPHTPQGCVEGDLVLCLPVAKRQAKRRGHSPREELLLYAIHGLLHLDGEDDLEPKAFEKMHRREDEILQAIGMKALFAGNEPWAQAQGADTTTREIP